jgi:hypothetical protein
MEYINEYYKALSTHVKEDKIKALTDMCDKHPDRCAECYYTLATLVDDNNKKFEYALKASKMSIPSDDQVADRSIYEWKAMDFVCIYGYYTGNYYESLHAHGCLKENSHYIPESYREQCINNGKFSMEAVDNIHSLSRFQQSLKTLPTPLIGDTDIPNYYHIMWFKGNRKWIMVHYLSVLLVKKMQNPLAIYIYNDIEPENNKWWDLTKTIQGVHIVKAPVPTFINNKQIPWVQHKADVARIYTIYERGGVYIDSDLLLYRDVSNILVKGKVNMSYQNANGVWNGFIAAPPKHPYMMEWINAYKSLYGSSDVDHWAGLSINMPFTLSNRYPNHVNIMPSITFLPFGWHDDNLYTDGCTDSFMDSYGMHLWETEAEKRGVLPMDTQWLESHKNTPFYRLFAGYLDTRQG